MGVPLIQVARVGSYIVGQKLRGRERFPLVVSGLFLLGLTLEVLQAVLGHRTMSLGDVIANTAGIAVGIALALLGLRSWCFWVERWLRARPSP